MTNRQYIGARYVPKFYEGTNGTEWDSNVQYEPLTIVTYLTNSYTSKKTVPASVGNPIQNPTYWVSTGNYNAQVEEYREEVDKIKGAYKVLSGEGGIGDGKTDNTSIISSIINSIGSDVCTLIVDPGKYLINGTITIPSNIILQFTGGMLHVGSNGNLTINSEVIAPLYKIFIIDGAFAINSAKNTSGYPEWFDDLATAIKYFQKVELQCKDYALTSNVNITKDNFVLSGYSYSTFMSATKRGSRIVEQNGRLIIGDISGRDISAFPRNITVENVELVQTSNTLPVMSVYGVVYGRFKNLTFSCSGNATYGVYVTKATSTIFDSCRVQVTNSTATTFYGFYLTDEGNPVGAGGNASLYLKYCTVADTGSSTSDSYGFSLIGNCSDAYLDHCETVTCSTGLYIHGANAENGINDVIITNSIFDACKVHGITISSISVKGVIHLDNIYAAKDVENTPDNSIFIVENCKATILAKNLEGISLNSRNIGLQLLGDCNGIFDGAFNGMNSPYVNTGSSTNVSVKYMHDSVLTEV